MVESRSKANEKPSHALEHEGGFSLAELLVTILIMGLLFGIASTTWFGVVENRQVDSAANQLAADLRLAHTKAINRLTDWRAVLPAPNPPAYCPANRYYELRKTSPPTQTISRCLPDGTQIGTTITLNFKSDGSAQVISGPCCTIIVRSTRGPNPRHIIEFNTVTSRIKIDPIEL